MTDFYKEKMLIDVTGRPIPQYYDEEKGVFIAKTNGTGDASNVDFRKKKMLIDVQSFPIPQYYDVVEGVFKPITSDGSSGDSAPSNWDDITGKPSEFKPTAHGHKTSDVEGLDEKLTEVDGLKEKVDQVFTQVSNGKSLLETVIIQKGSNVSKVGDIPTFEELKKGINEIPTGGGGGDNCPLPGVPIGAKLTEIIKQPIVQIEVLRNIELVEVTE